MCKSFFVLFVFLFFYSCNRNFPVFSEKNPTIQIDTVTQALQIYSLEIIENSKWNDLTPPKLNPDTTSYNRHCWKSVYSNFKHKHYAICRDSILKIHLFPSHKPISAYIYNLLAKSYFHLGEIDLATAQAKQSAFIAIQTKELILLRDAYWLLSDIERRKGNFSSSCHYHVKYDELKDSVLNNYKATLTAELQKRKAFILHEKELINTEKKDWQKISFSTLASLILVLGTICVFIKAKKRKEALLAEEITSLEQKVGTISKSGQNISRQMMQNLSIVKMIGQTNCNSFDIDAAWSEFYNTLNNVYPGFVEQLKSTYSSLTEKDIQLCCLEKVKFETGEMAFILKVQPSTIHMRRSAIRKKLNAEKGQNLSDFLVQFCP